MNIKPINLMLILLVVMALALRWQSVASVVAMSAPGVHAAAPILSIENLLNSKGMLNTRTSARGALDLRGWNVTLDSTSGPILTRSVSSPAAPNIENWLALAHNGLAGRVDALAVIGSDLYVGGDFTQTADGRVQNLNHIARYSSGAWSALAHNGLDREVTALAVIGNVLYVGGVFFATADGALNLSEIARYDTSANQWSALAYNSGLTNSSDSVQALAVNGSNLYVGGKFTGLDSGNTMDLCYIAGYATISNQWFPLAHGGLNWIVRTITVSRGSLYAGGDFTATYDNNVSNLNGIAMYSGGWSPLANHGLHGAASTSVRAITMSGSDLYVGGSFTQTADGVVKNLNHIARYSAGGWSALANNGLNGAAGASAIALVGSDLYVGGDFTQTADGAVTNLNRIARYSGWTWSTLANHGLDDAVTALAGIGKDLYIGGDFSQTADGTNTKLDSIAKYAPGYSCYLPIEINY